MARDKRPLQTLAAVCCLLAPLALACSSGQAATGPGTAAPGEGTAPLTLTVDNQLGEPITLRYRWDTAVASPLGTIDGRSSATFQIPWRAMMEVRIVADFTTSRRTATSNPMPRLNPGDSLHLTIRLPHQLILEPAGR